MDVTCYYLQFYIKIIAMPRYYLFQNYVESEIFIPVSCPDAMLCSVLGLIYYDWTALLLME